MENQYTFLGRFDHKIDGKCRVTIPKDFYRQLDEKRLILTKTLVADTPMIAVFPTREILISELVKIYDFDFDDVNYRRSIVEDFYYRDIDSAGRINLNSFDIFSGDMATIIGNFDFFEIWDASAYDRVKKEVGKHR